MILLVNLEMLRECLDSLSQQSDLNFGRSGIGLVMLKLSDQFLFSLRISGHFSFFSFSNFFYPSNLDALFTIQATQLQRTIPASQHFLRKVAQHPNQLHFFTPGIDGAHGQQFVAGIDDPHYGIRGHLSTRQFADKRLPTIDDPYGTLIVGA